MKKKYPFIGKEYILVFLFAAVQIIAPKEYAFYITVAAVVVLFPLFLIKLIYRLKKEKHDTPRIFLDSIIKLALLILLLILGYIIISA